ncbi:shikimate kinase [Aequorivita sp. SDUM287046]|uniref:Shikimate kinase n=1 Tax=Aequorivita aurantiaca TaxID=3053356 RepID=A0ABT8DN67_9FLAO|nr:shikimate kinase [Aequorivita aurantiaca]MDN3725320.1 shikimate kinase [Aequorivita aurantiaca]
MKIILIGYMGSGKSSVGRELAARLGVRFIDLDAEIEIQENVSISKIFSEKGEIFFRKLENFVLQRILQLDENYVLATGGGTPCYGNAMEIIIGQKDAISIYLKTSVDRLIARLVTEKDNRPLLAHLKNEAELNEFVRKHLFERSYFYNQAGIKVENEGSVSDTVEKITSLLF